MLRFVIPAVAIGAVLLMLGGTIEWGGMKQGEGPYQRDGYATAAREFRPLAEQGEALAQSRLGVMYARGEDGVPRDYAKALKWLRKAAVQGVAEAQFELAELYLMYHNGDDVRKDDAEMVKWYRKAAMQGFAEAQYTIGTMYHTGFSYGTGQSVPQDNVQAHMWYDLAVAQGFKWAARLRNTAADRMTSAQIAEAQRLAREWLAKHQGKK